MALEIRIYTDYEEVEPAWRELEAAYRRGELTWDLEAHRIIWRGFYRDRGAVLRIHAAYRGSSCVGIVPLLHTHEDAEGHWTFCDDFLIGREYYCPPELLPELLRHLPPHLADDLSCFYVPRPADSFERLPGAMVDLGPSQEAYLDTLSRKARYQMRRTLARNTDLVVERDTRVRWSEIGGLRERYQAYWTERARGDPDRVAYSRDKVATDLELMGRAQELQKLVALYFRLEGRLVAANFAVLRGADRVDDYLCLRDAAAAHYDRALGILAVLRNMEACRALGVRFYDLSACVTEYKKRFLNMESWYHGWAAGPRYRPAAGGVSALHAGSA